jgi:hypothetical protein
MDALHISLPPAIRDLRKVLPFVAELAAAKSAGDAATVIEAAAVPIATYQLKSKRHFVSINALVGISAGAEYVHIGKTSWTGVIGPFAPIGVHTTWPTSFGHIGGFFSVINLGTLVAARFASDIGPVRDGAATEVSQSPKFDFLNLLAPGAFLTVGIDSSPFVLGGGAQVVPARHVTRVASDGTDNDTATPAVQAIGFVSVDVPILEL